MFKSFRKDSVAIIIFWILIVAFAIFNLPNVTNLINDSTGSHRLTPQITAVYHTKRGFITGHRQAQINTRVNRLRRHRSTYDVSQITDVNNDHNGLNQLESAHRSTELVKIRVPQHFSNLLTLTNELRSQLRVPHLKINLTSPQILSQARTEQTVKLTHRVLIVTLIISCLLLGLCFRSIVIPITSLITLSISLLTSTSLLADLARHHLVGINQITPLAIVTTTLIIGTGLNFWIYRRSINELPAHRDAYNAADATMKATGKPILGAGITLVIASTAALLITNPVAKVISSLGLIIGITSVAATTLNPVFIAWLGELILWPSHSYTNPHGEWLWQRLVNVSLWQPLAGIIIVAYLIAPFAFAYHPSVNYESAPNDLSNRNQAVVGAQELQAHFCRGKATPVTITLKSHNNLAHERQLKPIDDLTTKLQSMPGVNTVCSVTQPGGEPVAKNYVTHQLSTLNQKINGAQNELHASTLQSTKDRRQLSPGIKAFTNQLHQVKGAQARLSKVTQNNHLSLSQSGRLNRKVANFKSQVNALNQQISQASDQLNSINQAHHISQLKAVNRQLGTIRSELKATNRKLNGVYNYLNALKNSGAANVYYVTPSQINDTDFQQDLYNTNHGSPKLSQLEVTFNQAPSTRFNRKRIRHLKSEIHTQLQGTPLRHAKVELTGQPVEQAATQNSFRNAAIRVFIVILGICGLALMLISRSILNPIYWMISFGISSLAGLQITELISNFTTDQGQINWQILSLIIVTLSGFAIVELFPLGLKFRKLAEPGKLTWLKPTFTSLGKNQPTTLMITILTAGGLLGSLSYSFAQIAVAIIASTVIFSLVLPLLTTAFNKLAIKISHSKYL